jgi:hypothetical protein
VARLRRHLRRLADPACVDELPDFDDELCGRLAGREASVPPAPAPTGNETARAMPRTTNLPPDDGKAEVRGYLPHVPARPRW